TAAIVHVAWPHRFTLPSAELVASLIGAATLADAAELCTGWQAARTAGLPIAMGLLWGLIRPTAGTAPKPVRTLSPAIVVGSLAVAAIINYRTLTRSETLYKRMPATDASSLT